MVSACVVIVPVLRRPHRVAPTIETFGDVARVLFVCTQDDTEEQHALRNEHADYLVLPGPHDHGDYARKVNFAYRETTEPLLFLGADDLLAHPGWLGHAVAELNDQIHVVGTNDLGNRRTMRGEHATHSLVSRAYIDEYGTIDQPGRVLHEGYWHEFVDDEFVQTARARGMFVSAHQSKVEHLHPLWRKAPTDELYDQHVRRMKVGRRVYERRQPLWMFPSSSQPSVTAAG